MKRVFFLASVTLAALGTAGCAILAPKPTSVPAMHRPRAFALAVTVNRVLQPTPQQWASIQAKVAENLATHGWVLVTDLALADHILRIDFTPNPNDPENSGHAQILGIRANPRIAIASTTSVGRYPTSFSYLGNFQNATWGYGGFSNNYYYGWGNSYHDGYSYGSANLNPTAAPIATTPVSPPRRHPPGNREDRSYPSDNHNYIRPLPVRLPGDYASVAPSDHPRTPPSSGRGRWRGGDGGESQPGSTYARADGSQSQSNRGNWRPEPSASRQERTYARSDPSSSRPERTYTRSEGSESRPERSYSRSDGSSWRSERGYSGSDGSGSRPERSYSGSDGSGSRPERSYSRSDSSGSERTYSRSESSHSRSESGHSRSSHASSSESSSPSNSAPSPADSSSSSSGASEPSP